MVKEGGGGGRPTLQGQSVQARVEREGVRGCLDGKEGKKEGLFSSPLLVAVSVELGDGRLTLPRGGEGSIQRHPCPSARYSL